MAAVLAAAAPAYAESEPNNAIGEANGPMVENVATEGSLFSAGDEDFTKFWVRKGAQVRFTYTGTSPTAEQADGVSSVFDVRILDSRGESSLSDGAYQVGMGESGTLSLTAPATGTYYIGVRVSPGYQTTITDPIAYSVTAAGGGALLLYDPIVCDGRGVDLRRVQTALNRTQGQLDNARRNGRRTGSYKRKLKALTRQRDDACAAREVACR